MNATPALNKLTKKFLDGLPEGVFLVSSVCLFSPAKALVAEIVVPMSQRSSQWGRIREARADQRSCMVFKTKEDHKAFIKRWKQVPDGRWKAN